MSPLKMRVRAALVAVMLAVGVSVTGWSSPASADTMTQRNASQIIADMGAGWNLGNSLEANTNGVPNETAWNNPTVTQSLIDSVQAAGFDTIRIPVSYLNHIGSGPNYTINANWLNRIQQVVDYAYDQGMHVVINMHGDGYKTVGSAWLICDASNQTVIKAKYKSAWQQIATRFRDYDQRLILESMNENFDGQYGAPTQPCYSNINAYNQIFVDTVRQTGGNNGSRWLLVPGWNTNIDYTTGNYGFVIPTDNYRSSVIPSGERRIMISVHYYAPWDFAGEENGTITQWGPNATNASKTSTWGQEDYMDSQMKKTYDAFVSRGYPVVVGEYGSIDKTSHDSANNRYRQDFARTMVATAKKYGAATIYWDNGVNGQYGFGLFNRSSNAVTQQGIVNAIMSGLDAQPSGSTPIVGAASNRCLDIPNASTANGTQAQLWDCNQRSNQQFTRTSAGELRVSGKCLEASGWGTANGTKAAIWDCTGGANQRWNVNSNGTITNAHNGLCLDANGAATANGTPIILWTCNGGSNQRWTL
ncbi:cellulase family glycosylhydrolase [Glycomyces niveus]|uniref:Cellulase family glycosylhydrolase n=1 Tax=Glycomyces niveus TaxID=2820287 RepID=A0ABS3TYZ3_9ACTN|nr:cellulase family glycosylhydrolase [Glycomyces sp. NEAU-S30]MBO3731734.1 cellulase family glycosylhydrolase [Glycomyces sp. NEAU-S30]